MSNKKVVEIFYDVVSPYARLGFEVMFVKQFVWLTVNMGATFVSEHIAKQVSSASFSFFHFFFFISVATQSVWSV